MSHLVFEAGAHRETIAERDRLKARINEALAVLVDIEDHYHAESCPAYEDADEPPLTTPEIAERCECTTGMLWRVREVLKG